MSHTGASTLLSYSLTLKTIPSSVSNTAQSVQFIKSILSATHKTGFLSSGFLTPLSLPRSRQDTRRIHDTPSNSSPLPCFQIGSRTPYSMDSGGGGSQRVKRLGQETNHSNSSRVYGKNDWISTPTPIRLRHHLTPLLPHY